MKLGVLFVAVAICGNAFAQGSEAHALARSGGESVVSVLQTEGLAGAVKLSRECAGQVASGGQSAYYCLGVEAASMLSLRRGAGQGAEPSALSWFEGEAMTERVLSYCYTHLGLKGDMQCLQQMGRTKAAVEPVVAQATLRQ